MLPNKHLPVNATLYQHQCQAADTALTRLEDGGGATLLMEMGTGKTLTSIAIVGQLWKERRIRKVLIVAPLSILGVWDEEFQKFAAFDYEMTVLSGSLARKAETIRHTSGPALQVLVVNYESAWRLETELLRWHPDCIIADECHKIKTHNARASKTLHKLGAAAKYRLALTGTVITNKPIDVFSQYKFADPSVFGGSFYLFRNRYFDMMGYGKYTPVMKQAMETEFTQRLHSIAFRATKAECLDLPDATDVIQRIDLEPAALRVYRQLVKDSYTELQDGTVTVTNVLTRLLRVSQLTGGFLGSDEDPRPEQVSSAKLDALEEILESVDGQKLVIIARFLPEIRAIEQMLTRKGVRYAIIHGGITDRAAQVTAFQTDPMVQVFIGQIATAGLGITLTGYTALRDFNLADAMRDELNGMDITFDRVTIPSAGGTTFELPGALPGETDAVKEFTGVILYHHPLFSFYRERFTGGNNAPDCGSYDGVTGIGDPGGDCASCPLNQFGSGENGGKACKNKRRIYILREGEIIPLLLTLPTGSMKEFAVYIKRLLTKGKKSQSVVTRFSLKKVSNTSGIAYSQAQFAVARMLTAEETPCIAAMAEHVKQRSTHVDYEAEAFPDEIIDPETGEVTQPLQ